MKKGVLPEDGGGGSKSKGNNSSYFRKNRNRNEKRLGGKGLSLEAFANAKSGPSGYNPALIKKQREFYRNAKYVKKYKKSLKQEGRPSGQLPMAPRFKTLVPAQDGDDTKEETKVTMDKKKQKKKQSLQSLREDFEKRQAEEEKARREREAMIQAKKEERARAEARRKALRGNMFKKTRSGQPVMKYRIEHLLEGLNQSPPR